MARRTVTIAAKKIGEKFEVASIVDGEFSRAWVDESLDTVILKGIGPWLNGPHEEGYSVSLNLILDDGKKTDS